MLKIGCHLSIAKGYTKLGETAVEIGANTFQFFSRNPRGAKAKEIDPKDIKGLHDILEKNHFTTLLAHAPYTMNLAAKEERIRQISKKMMKEDIKRLDQYLPENMYNFHPGSHVGQGTQKGINWIIQALNEIITHDQKTLILLETMSGKGSEIGEKFEAIRQIIDGVEIKEKLGVCLDTCHIHDAGYDIKNHLDDTIDEFDHIIGLEKLKAIHLNDSQNEKGSHKDRHACIGQGTIGLEAIANIINHQKLYQLPFYLETPIEEKEHAQEIAVLKEKYNH